MSYCVNCGVELAESEKICPLCHVEVVNPVQPWVEPKKRPYPTRADNLLRRAERRYVVGLAALLLLIPMALSLLCNYLISGELSWSLYVVSSILMVYVFVLFPFALKKPNFDMCMVADTVLTILFLELLELLSGGDWFWSLAFPLTILFCALLAGTVKLSSYIGGMLMPIALSFFSAAIFLTAVQIMLSLYRNVQPLVSWSLYGAVPLVILGLALLIIRRRRKLKNELKKRFHI